MHDRRRCNSLVAQPEGGVQSPMPSYEPPHEQSVGPPSVQRPAVCVVVAAVVMSMIGVHDQK
jgi:hypothetical protein